MPMKLFSRLSFALLNSAVLFSCSSLTLENVNFAWPVESVLTVGQDNRVEEGRYALSLSVAQLAEKEFEDSTALRGSQLRVIRSGEGYYFVTGPRFKNVYVFAPGAAELSAEGIIEVSQTGLSNPALNQRPPHVELLDGPDFRKLLRHNGIVEDEKK